MNARATISGILPALCAAALLAAAPRAARASAADAFENKVKPVSGQLYTKAGKLEIAPEFQLSANDAFFSKYLAGLRLGYHLTEHLSVAVSGVYAVGNSATGSTSVCTPGGGCQPAEDWRLYRVPGYLNYVAGAEVAWSPIYGKLNVFAEKAVHFDLSIFGGPDYVAYRGVNPTAVAGAAKPADEGTIGGHLGLGTRVFLGRSVALELQVRDLVYSVSGIDSGLQNQLLFQLGLSFFVPLRSQETP